jgi:hypothetical protein
MSKFKRFSAGWRGCICTRRKVWCDSESSTWINTTRGRFKKMVPACHKRWEEKIMKNSLTVWFVKSSLVLGPVAVLVAIICELAPQEEVAVIGSFPLSVRLVIALVAFLGLFEVATFVMMCMAFWFCRGCIHRGLSYYYKACTAWVLCMGRPYEHRAKCQAYGLPADM